MDEFEKVLGALNKVLDGLDRQRELAAAQQRMRERKARERAAEDAAAEPSQWEES